MKISKNRLFWSELKVPYILICEGEKDVLVASANDIPAVCFQSCSTVPERHMIRELLKHADYLVSCYDNDPPGQKGSDMLEEQFDIIKYSLESNFNDLAEYLPNAQSKDFKALIWDKVKEYRKNKNLKIWIENDSYVKYKKADSDDTKIQISNFIIEVDAIVKTSTEPERLIRLVSNDNGSSTLSVNYDFFNSEVKFHSFVSSQGNFYFHGSKSDLQEITKTTFKFSDTLDKASQMGWDNKREIFVLSNGIISKGNFIKPNRLGIYKDLLIPTAGEKYIPQQGDNFHIRYESNSNITLTTFISYLTTSFGSQIGYTSFAFLLASINFDWLSQTKGRNFPILNIDGQARTGKGTLIKLLLSVFSPEFKEVSLHNMSPKFMPRKLCQTPSIPVWFDEYLNSLPDSKIQTLKNFFDLIGRNTAAYTGGNETLSSRVESPVIITGEEAPVNNEALYSRLIVLSLPTVKRTSESIERMNTIELELSKGISHLLAELISYREIVKAEFEKDYTELLAYYRKGLGEMKVEVDTRIVKNYCKIFAPLLSISKAHASLGVEPDNIKTKSFMVMSDHTSSQQYVDDVNVFLQDFISCNNLTDTNVNSIKEDRDYNYDPQTKLLYLHSSCFEKAASYHLQIHQRPCKDPKALQKYITSKPYYKGRAKKYFNIGLTSRRAQARCMSFDLTRMPEMIRDFFTIEEE